MPLTLVATAQPEAYRVQLDATGAPGPVTFSRTNPGGTSVIVRGGQNLVPVGGAITTHDWEAPLGVPLTYTATSGAESATVEQVVLDLDTPVLSHPSLTGFTQPVVIGSDDPRWEASTVLHNIVGRRDPVASVQPMRRRGGTLVLLMPDVPATDNLIAAWADGWPLYLRVPCSNVRGGWLSAITLDETASGSPAGDRRTVTVNYQVVAEPPVTTYITTRWTFEDLLAEEATFADVLASYATFADLRAKIPVTP